MSQTVRDGVRARLMAIRIEAACMERVLRSIGASKRQLRYIADILGRCDEIELELMNGEVSRT